MPPLPPNKTCARCGAKYRNKCPHCSKRSSKKTVEVSPRRIPLAIRSLATHLEQLKSELQGCMNRLDTLYVALFTVGLDTAGPIVESQDDIPF